MFPKAPDLRRYWQNICNGVNAIEEVPPDRWQAEHFFNPDRLAPDQVYSKWGGFLDKVPFDPVKWRIPPASLRSIEPIQLLALETAAQAMADAGYDRRDFPRDQTGVVFAIAGSHDLGIAYAFRTLMRYYLPKVEDVLAPEARARVIAGLEEHLPKWTEDSFPGFLANVVAGRIARELDLGGPNYVVDAACAASLAALHTAVEQLRSGTTDLMLVGAADATNSPFCFMSFAKTHALSPRGRSRPFDDSGDGIALGEGLACVVLKRLADAERDGDKIYAVIKGVGASSDGKNRSLTAPHPPGQMRAVKRAYQDAQVSPATVSLIEAHGTGTVVGDSAELTTLTEVFTPHSPDRQYAAIGSVKSMIGHTKTVAGLASLIKTVLALKHRVLPPTLGIEKPTRRVDFAQTPFYLNTETRPWLPERGDHPRRAGVSAFGFGGTNFHVVLEEYTGGFHPGFDVDLMPRPVEVLLFRRAGRPELLRDLRDLDRRLVEAPAADLGRLACALWHEETHRPDREGRCRLGIVAGSVAELRQKLQKALTLLAERNSLNDPSGLFYSEAVPVTADQLCFLYPGQGSQTVNMLRDLVAASPWAHDLFACVNRRVADLLPQPLTRYVYPLPVFDDADRKRQVDALNDTRVAQPALGLVELFATQLLERFGLRPGLVAGHSYGELVAVYAAGCLSEDELMRLSALRGRVCAEASESNPGAMAAVRADAATTRTALDELGLALTLANLNAPDQTIIAGPAAVIDAAVAGLPQKGLNARRLPVTAAFHSPMLLLSLEKMTAIFAQASFQKPQRPIYSNTTGGRHGDDPEVIRRYLAHHFTEPVLFEKQVRQLYADGARVFLEVGPGKVLSDLVGRILKEESVVALPLDAPGREGWTQLGHLLARAAVLGLPVQLDAWFAGRGLPAEPLADFLDKARAQGKPKPTDWILSAYGAEPVTPLPAANPPDKGRTEGRPAPVAEPPSTKPAAVASPPPPKPAATPAPPPPKSAALSTPPAPPSPPLSSPVPNRPPQPALTTPPILQTMKAAMTTSNGDTTRNGKVTGHAHPGLELFVQVQATTRLLLKMQQAQQQLVERFLETQERMLAYCAQGMPALPAPAHPPALTAPAPAAEAAPPLTPPRVLPTAAAARPAVPMPARASDSAARRVVVPAPAVAERKPVPVPAAAATAPKVPEVSAPAPAVVATNGDGEGPPPTETFRRDLLQVVSERTGYPVDMLDETLPLEAGLGIDSIKTVEIFSKLKAYHPYFREGVQDEEELLAEFSRLKTLKDITDAYQRHRQAYHAVPVNVANGVPLSGPVADKKTNGAVERYTVAATEAPLEGNGAKKAFRTATSS
jgi:acyl transferase domain-containing protein